MAEKTKKISLMEKYYTPELAEQLKGVKSSSGFTIDDVVRSGKENPDSGIGVYAGDHDSYIKFAPLFDKIIKEYHGYDRATGKYVANLDASQLTFGNPDPEGKYIQSTRIRVGRNLDGFAFSPALSREDRLEVERQVVAALKTLTGDLKGEYYPLGDMPEDVRVRLVEDHFLFKKGDRFLESAGCNRDWPAGRGIFHSADKKFLVWVNEEDELRIISMQPGGDIKEVFERLSRAIATMEKMLKFAFDDQLGWLSSCPTNLGTAMRASVHIKLPKFSKQPEFHKFCDDLKLSVRGIHGEHSESEGGVFDISNKQRLGISEVDAANILYNGVVKLIEKEGQL